MKNSSILITLTTAIILCLPKISFAQACNSELTPSTPDSRYSDNNNGTVTDNVTKLMWKKCAEGQTYNSTSNGCDGTATAYVANDALAVTDALNDQGFNNHKDWRIPNVKELGSIIETTCVNPSININLFPNTNPSYFWTSTTWVGLAPFHYNLLCVNFGNGSTTRLCDINFMGGMGGMGGPIITPEAHLRFVRDQ